MQFTAAQLLERARYYARQRSRHERTSMGIFESLRVPGTYRVFPLDSDDERGDPRLWALVEEFHYQPKMMPHERPHWFMARLWQTNPTKRRRRKKTPTGRRSCYFDADPCVYCGDVPKKPSTEHAIPKSHGGPGGWDNRVSACYKCNTYRNNWPLLLWLWALHRFGSPKHAAKELGRMFPDRTVFYVNNLDKESLDEVSSDDEDCTEADAGIKEQRPAF